MGGGDLNLKKSWHPSTMKNMEKVWKAEQQKHQEKKKIAELKKELEMEKDREDLTKYAMEQGVIEKKDEKKLDWMYKGPHQMVNREEYLLGRPIDKSFEQMAQAEKDAELNRAPKNHVEHECIPPSLRFFSGNEQVDLARKMQEDPLYAIKKKEMETRSQLLKNPVKLKQLRQLLEEQSKKEKSDKKRKKKKKHKHGSHSNNDDTELDLLLTTKYKELKTKISEKDLIKSMKKVKHKRKMRSEKDSDDSSSDTDSSSKESSDDEIKKKRKKKSRSESRESIISHKKLRKEIHMEKNTKKKYGLQDGTERYNRERSSSREKSESSNHERIGRTHTKERKKDFYSRSSHHKRNEPHRQTAKNIADERYISQAPTGKSYDTSHIKNKEDSKEKMRWNPKKPCLTEEEKERRRQEMIANATWRDKEREKNVKQYREEETKEITSSKTYNQDFIRKQLAVAAEIGTVESRIKSNINNIQRSGRAMDTNFAKR